MIRSFRVRLALLSALLSGLVLAAFGLGSLWLIRGVQTEKIDLEVRSQAERQAARVHEDADWPQVETQVQSSMGVRDPADMAMLAQTVEGEDRYRSARWPTALRPDQLNWPRPGERPARPGFGMGFIAQANAAEPPSTAGQPLLLAAGGGGAGGGGGGGGSPGGRATGGPPGGPGVQPPGTVPPPGVTPPEAGPVSGIPSAGPPTNFQAVPGPAAINVPPTPERSPRAPESGRPPTENPVSSSTLTPRILEPQGALPSTSSAPAAIAAPETVAPQITPIRPVEPAAGIANPALASPSGPPPASGVMNITVDGQTWRIGLASTERGRVAVAVNQRVMDSDLRSIRNAFLLALPFALALIGMGSWFFSGRAMGPVNKLTAATQRVTADDLSRRIPVQGEDQEFAELIQVFNRMLERLERSFQQAQRFSADAAHELKTPLAIVQGQLERAMAQAGDGSPLQSSLSSVLDEVRRLSTISRKLLILSQADAGRLRVHTEPFDMSAALQDLLEDTRMLAPHLLVSGEIQPGLWVRGDASLLRQVLHNLISNAIKYNAHSAEHPGWIRINTARWAKQLEVVVSNASDGIAVSDRDRIFQRFYRVDSAHSRAVEGVGLGLSVSREIARAHGGDLTLKADRQREVQFSLLMPFTG